MLLRIGQHMCKTWYYKYVYNTIIKIKACTNIIQVAQNLENKYLKYAPNPNQEKINHIVGIYKYRKNVRKHIADKAAMSLYMPSAFGRVGEERQAEQGWWDLQGLREQIPKRQFLPRGRPQDPEVYRQDDRPEGETDGDPEERPAESRALHALEETIPQ